jgi:hypothetical protein
MRQRRRIHAVGLRQPADRLGEAAARAVGQAMSVEMVF